MTKFVWGIALFVSLFVNSPIIMINLPRLAQPIVQLDLLLQVLFSFVYALVLIWWIYGTSKGSKAAVLQWSGVLACLVLYSISLVAANYFIIGLPLKTAGTVVARGFMMAVILYFFSRFITEVERKNEVLLENEQLKHENLLVQLNALKSQLNPHFLFNSLNTLSWLINDDKEKSQRYLQNLAQVLRYILAMQEQPLVSLKEEMDLVNNYVYLLQMRFGDNLKITNQIQGNAPLFRLPPLSLQLLIENAIRHNVISSAHPLHICIECCQASHQLMVRNSFRPRPGSEGTGTGLANLNQRCVLLLNKEIEIRQDQEFCVTLPLMP